MRKLLFLLALITLLLSCSQKPNLTNISGSISLKGDLPVDSLYIGLYKYRRPGSSQYTSLGKPFHFAASVNKTFSFNVDPGVYSLVVWTFGYESLRENIYISNGQTDITADIFLLPKGIPEDFKRVQITGEFCNYMVEDSPDMIKTGNKWIINDTTLVAKGARYKFIIDGVHCYDLRQNQKIAQKEWSTFDNIHSGENPILFDPSLYRQQMEKSTIAYKNFPLNSQFNGLSNALNAWEKDMRKKRFELRNASYQANKEFYQSLLFSLDSIEVEYDSTLHQKILETRVSRLFYLHPIWSKIRENYNSGLSDTSAINAIHRSEEFISLCESTMEMINKINPSTHLLSGDFVSGVNAFESFTDYNPAIAKRLGIGKDFYFKYILNFVKECPQLNVCAEVLYRSASTYAINNESTKAKQLIELLKDKYADDFYVGEGHADAILSQFKIQIGAEAPQFSVQTLAGDSLKLSDYKGQFVFLDFWGTWCGPCIAETPNLKALAKTISTDLTWGEHEKVIIKRKNK